MANYQGNYTTADCNAVTISGIFTYSGWSNRPSDASDSSGTLEVIAYNTSCFAQYFYSPYDRRVWYRTNYYGSFTAWTQIQDSSGMVPVAAGGTGTTSYANLRGAMGLGYATGALPIANGGTGATDAATARTNLGLSGATGIQNLDIRAGTVSSWSINKTGINSLSVTFSPARLSVPTAVLATVFGSNTSNIQYWAFSSGNYSTTGCTIYAYRTTQESGTGTLSLQWIAV